MTKTIQLGVHASAIYGGTDQKYRYVLTRSWDKSIPFRSVLFLMLNPSTATEFVDDPTVSKCQTHARLWGYGGIVVCNIFSFRSTYPNVMKKAEEPIGPMNNYHIDREALAADLVICAWGNNGDHLARGRKVLSRLHEIKCAPMALALTKSGQPQHPLYISYSTRPFPLEKTS